jgi:hypothetical protein
MNLYQPYSLLILATINLIPICYRSRRVEIYKICGTRIISIMGDSEIRNYGNNYDDYD